MANFNAAESTDTSAVDISMTTADGTDQYLTFIMENEEYGVDILSVQEIRGWESATPIPKAPAHIRGVINLRGTIVPLIDLRQCFGLGAIEFTATTVVIVLKVETEKGPRTMGIVVDAVSDVYTLGNEQMKAAPDMGDGVRTDYIHGLASIDGKMVILLDIDKLLSADELPDMGEVSRMLETAAQQDSA